MVNYPVEYIPGTFIFGIAEDLFFLGKSANELYSHYTTTSAIRKASVHYFALAMLEFSQRCTAGTVACCSNPLTCIRHTNMHFQHLTIHSTMRGPRKLYIYLYISDCIIIHE